jgi:hypothetical protein
MRKKSSTKVIQNMPSREMDSAKSFLAGGAAGIGAVLVREGSKESAFEAPTDIISH